MNDEMVRDSLKTVVQLLAFLNTADIEDYVNNVSHNNSMYDAVGAILDPTEYRNTLQSGKRNAARMELDLVRKLLEVRRAV